MFTEKQIKWCKSHDWFHDVLPNGNVRVIDSCVNVNTLRSYSHVVVWNGSFAELRNWAGY